MPPCGAVDAVPCFCWNCRAKRLWGVGVAETPEGFDFAGGQVEGFGYVEVGGEVLDSGRGVVG